MNEKSESRMSKPETIGERFAIREKQETGGSLALAQDCSEDVHQLTGFGGKADAFLRQLQGRSAVEQAQPIGRLFGFFSACFDPQQEVLFAHRLVRLDVVGTHRAGGANKLLDIFEILYRSRKPFHEASRFLPEQERPFLQIVRSFIRWLLVFLHFLDSSSNCFEFRHSNFGFSIP